MSGGAALDLAFELAALDEGIDQLQYLTLLGWIELLDGQQSAAQAAVAILLDQAALAAAAEQFIDGDAQGGGDGGQQVGRRGGLRALVVGNHALGDPQLGGEFDLGEAGGLIVTHRTARAVRLACC